MIVRASVVPWDYLQHDDIDVYAENIFSAVENIARECIPSRNVQSLHGLHLVLNHFFVNVSEQQESTKNKSGWSLAVIKRHLQQNYNHDKTKQKTHFINYALKTGGKH